MGGSFKIWSNVVLKSWYALYILDDNSETMSAPILNNQANTEVMLKCRYETNTDHVINPHMWPYLISCYAVRHLIHR